MQRNTTTKKGRLELYAILIILVLLAMTLLRFCSSERRSHPAPVPAHGDTINVAIEYTPMGIYSEGDTLGGLGYRMMSEVARMGNLEVRFTPLTSLARALEGLEQGIYDVVIAEMPITNNLRSRYTFSDPVYLDRQVIVQRVDSAGNGPVDTQLDLAGKAVTVAAGSPAIERLARLAREIGDTIYLDIDSTYSSEQLFLLVATGQKDMAVVNASTAERLLPDYPGVDASRGISFTRFQSWVLTRRRPEVALEVDSLLRLFKSTPLYDSIVGDAGVHPAPKPE